MTRKKQLQDDLKHAMRQRDEVRKRTLRLALAAIKNKEIEIGGELDEAAVDAILHKEAKQRRETLEDLTRVDRPELLAAERAELEVLKDYLPQQLGRQEIADLARQVIADLDVEDARQMGQVMRALMPQVKGRADGKLVNEVVRELLSS